MINKPLKILFKDIDIISKKFNLDLTKRPQNLDPMIYSSSPNNQKNHKPGSNCPKNGGQQILTKSWFETKMVYY